MVNNKSSNHSKKKQNVGQLQEQPNSQNQNGQRQNGQRPNGQPKNGGSNRKLTLSNDEEIQTLIEATKRAAIQPKTAQSRDDKSFSVSHNTKGKCAKSQMGNGKCKGANNKNGKMKNSSYTTTSSASSATSAFNACFPPLSDEGFHYKKNNVKVAWNHGDDKTHEKVLHADSEIDDQTEIETQSQSQTQSQAQPSAGELLSAALAVPCKKCSVSASAIDAPLYSSNPALMTPNESSYPISGKPQYNRYKSYAGGSRIADFNSVGAGAKHQNVNGRGRRQYYRSQSDRRNSFDRNFAERNRGFIPIIPPAKPVLSSSNIEAVLADTEKLVIIDRIGKGKISYPIMQCGTLDIPESSYHQERSIRMDVYQSDDGFHSDGGSETPPPSPSSSSSIASTSDHGSLESVDTGGTQRLAVLSFEQVRKLHNVMDEKVAIYGRGNFPTLEVTLKDLVNLVRRKLEADPSCGGAGMIVKDIRLNGGAASHVLASEDQPYNDLDLIYAIELSSPRHFDRVKTAVLNSLLDLLPEGVSKRRILPCALKEAYVGKMVKVNNNNDGDRWSLISLGNSPGHKNVELKFVDTMRRQFEFSVDSFQIVLDSLLLFYDCAALPISENFYPTVVGESVYGDFQEALYHLQKKLISTRQPEEIRGGGLLKYCNLLVRNYKPVDPQHIKTLERYMCSRFFIDFPDIETHTVKLEAYLRNHFWGVDEEPLQYQYLMHLRDVVEKSTVCLMNFERRQTLHLIESLAAEVLYKEQQKHQQTQAHEQYHHHHHHHHQQHQHQQEQQIYDHHTHQQHHQQQQQQQQSQPVTLITTTTAHQHSQHQPQSIYVQQAQPTSHCVTVSTSAGICSTSSSTSSSSTDQKTQQQQQTTQNTVPQTIQIPPGTPSLIYANGVYYAPVYQPPICTCNSTWLST